MALHSDIKRRQTVTPEVRPCGDVEWGVVNRERLELLDECERRAGTGVLPVEDVLYALFAPAIRLSQDPERGRRFMRLCGRFYVEPADYLESVFEEEFADLLMRLEAAFRRAVPDLSEKELKWRVHFAVGAMVHTMMDSDRIRKWTRGLCDPTDVEGTLDSMVRFTAAGMKAAAPAPDSEPTPIEPPLIEEVAR